MADNETSIEKPPFYIRHFFLILVLLGILGGFLALTVPLWKSWAETPKTNCIEFILGWIGSLLSSLIPNHDDEKYPQGKVITDLRLHILYITGGIIAILTLLQTNWKNLVDRRKVEDDIQKNKNDHIRQVHAERRTRYAKAIEQLADDKAVIRLGGIYTLVGLVDEWIADDSKEKDGVNPRPEGQTIINNLCAYIRSPFSLAGCIDQLEEKTQKDNNPRTSPINQKYIQINTFISKYSNHSSLIFKKNYKTNKDNKQGKEATENCNEDYLDNISKYQEEQDLRRTIFIEISKRLGDIEEQSICDVWPKRKPGPWSNFEFDFQKAPIFYPLNNLIFENSDFSEAIFYDHADFSKAKFKETAKFNKANFKRDANFYKATFASSTKFEKAIFEGGADFRFSTLRYSDFMEAIFKGPADFSSRTRINDYQDYDYSQTIFCESVSFSGCTFENVADFRDTHFRGPSNFVGSTFMHSVKFDGASFHKESPSFANNVKTIGALFSYRAKKNDYSFSHLSLDSNFEIDINCITWKGKSFELPVHTRLFNPAVVNEERQEYPDRSNPVKPAKTRCHIAEKIMNMLFP